MRKIWSIVMVGMFVVLMGWGIMQSPTAHRHMETVAASPTSTANPQGITDGGPA
jgi:hypothetical protein